MQVLDSQIDLAVPEIREAVKGAPAGPYQESLISGGEAWSGASLKGKARDFGKSYEVSRGHLIRRINDRLPAGFRAETSLRLSGNPRRWRRELRIVAVDDPNSFIWWDDVKDKPKVA